MATITIKGKDHALSCIKSGELAQFGLALDLEHVSTGVNLKNICVHLMKLMLGLNLCINLNLLSVDRFFYLEKV